MGSGFVLTYLLIAAVVAPLVWVVWWAIASIGDTRVRFAPVAAPAAPVRELAPHAVDLGYASRPDRVVMRRLKDGLEVGSCHGPDARGRCPFKLADGTVPCAGDVISLPRAVSGSLEWQVPAGYRTCMLGAYAAFRQPATATAG